MRKKWDISVLFFKKFSKTKEGPYISKPAQSYRIDKICSHFGGVYQHFKNSAVTENLFKKITQYL